MRFDALSAEARVEVSAGMDAEEFYKVARRAAGDSDSQGRRKVGGGLLEGVGGEEMEDEVETGDIHGNGRTGAAGSLRFACSCSPVCEPEAAGQQASRRCGGIEVPIDVVCLLSQLRDW
jgi:hypothetical protein